MLLLEMSIRDVERCDLGQLDGNGLAITIRAWHSASQPNIAVVERGRPAEFVPTIIVNDRPHIAPSAGLSSTVITLGRSPSDAAVPDIRFEQISESTVRITTASRSSRWPWWFSVKSKRGPVKPGLACALAAQPAVKVIGDHKEYASFEG